MNTETKHLLAEHHRALDERLDRLLVRAKVAPPAQLRAEWTGFERDLLRHLEMEETEILPGFAGHDPGEAQALLAEHAQIRKALLDIGVSLDLHCLRVEAVEDLVSRLKRHAEREDGVLYPWADRELATGIWQRIKRGLNTAAAGGRRAVRLVERPM
jgi:hemerythrin-like domain-containing protein